jgi:hypothetical protein
MTDHAQTQATFARAVLDAKLPVPTDLRGQHDHRLQRRFSVYRNNVVASLIAALSTRFPVVQQLVGVEFFQGMARAYVAQHPPRLPILLYYGDSFADFIDTFAPAAPIPYLGDVARIEWARGAAYHTADVPPVDADAFTALPLDRLDAVQVRLHPSVSVVSSAHPAFSIWRVNQDPDYLIPVSPWGPEAALIARPHFRVQTKAIPLATACFIQDIANGATLGLAFATGQNGSPQLDGRDALTLLIAKEIVAGFDCNVHPLR